MTNKSKRNFEELENRRKKCEKLLAAGKSQYRVAQELGVSEASVSRWAKRRRELGKKWWSKRSMGAPRKFDTDCEKKLEKILIRGAQASGFIGDLWTLPRIASVIRKQMNLSIHPAHLWRIMKRLGWSAQRPESRAFQRDEKKIAHWKRYTWPALKKSHP